jgi:hypothetical protein
MIPENRIWRTIGVGARRAASWPFRVAAARATLKALANMDRRELISAQPSDVRDASTLPLDRDPTGLLAGARDRQRLWRSEVSRGDDGRRPAQAGGRTRLDCVRETTAAEGAPGVPTGSAVVA